MSSSEIYKKLLDTFKWIEKEQLIELSNYIKELKQLINGPLEKTGEYRESLLKHIVEDIDETFEYIRKIRIDIKKCDEKLKNYNSRTI